MTCKTANRLRRVLLTIALVALTNVILSSAAFSSHKPRARRRANPAAKPGPIELHNIEQLRTIFQLDDDKVRVVVLVSPT